MESLGDILKRLTAKSTSEGTGTWLAEDQPGVPPCPMCHGRKWVRLDVPVTDPRFGKAVLCSCQEETVQEQLTARLQRYSNLEILTNVTFESLDPNDEHSDPPQGHSYWQGYNAALEYAQEPRDWLLFTGPIGSGKTHLLAAIINKCIELGTPAIYMSVPDLLDHLRSTYAPTSEVTYDELFDHVRNTPVLALDDLGSHSSTAWAQEKLNQVLNHRFNRQLPTIVSVSVPLSQLDEQLRARLLDHRMVLMKTLGENQPSLQLHSSRLEQELVASRTFEGFDPKGNAADAQDRQALERALRVAQEFARDPKGWLVFIGEPGCGKTHLAAAILNYRMRLGYEVSFKFVPDLLDYLRATFSPQSPVTYDQLFEEVRSAPILVLDDLGAHTSTPWAEEKLYQIIVYRQETHLPTILTMRGFIEDLPSKSMASRLMDSGAVKVMPISAPSYREKRRRQADQRPRQVGATRTPTRGG